MTTATAAKPEKIGGLYDWEIGADGKYTIKGVEVFSAHARGENGVDYEVGDDWIEAAHKKLLSNYPKHAIPVNFNHHTDVGGQRKLGFLKPTHTDKVMVNGRVRNTIFGDVVGIEPHDFEDFRQTKYPFRSASIVSFSQHRFRDLSMLREKPGFYEYPILTLQDKDEAKSPMLAYHVDGDVTSFLYAFGANDKSSDKKKSKKPGDDKKKPGFPPKPGADGGDGGDAGEGADAGEEADADGQKVDADGNPVNEMGAGKESPTSGLSLDQKLDAILAGIKELLKDSCPSENDVNGDKSPMQDKGQKVSGQKKNYSAQEEAVSEPSKIEADAKKDAVAAESKTEAAKAVQSKPQDDAKYAAQEDRIARLERDASARKATEKAVADLEGAGYRLTKSTKDKIAEYAAEGEKALGIFIDTYKTHAEKDPSATVEGAATGAATKSAAAGVGVDEDMVEVAEYAAKNPQDVKGIKLRRDLYGDFDTYKKQGGSMTFERFVANESAVAATQMTVKSE